MRGRKTSTRPNPQWMTIAHQIELNPSNWVSGAVGVGSLFRGHMMSSPSTPCDSVYEGVTGSCDNFNPDPSKRRVFNIGNVEIWDFVGNILEWVDWTVVQADKAYRSLDSMPVGAFREFNQIDTNNDIGDVMQDLFWKPFTPGLMDSNGVGQYFAGGTDGTALRGGAFNNMGGLYALNLNLSAAAVQSNIGFRCVYNP